MNREREWALDENLKEKPRGLAGMEAQKLEGQAAWPTQSHATGTWLATGSGQGEKLFVDGVVICSPSVSRPSGNL